MTMLVLTGAVFIIISKMFHGRISLNSSAFAVASEFCGWVQFGIDVYILHRKYWVKPPWFLPACAAAINHRNKFFHLYQQNKSESKVKFTLATNCCKRVLEAAKLAHTTKTIKSPSLPRKVILEAFGKFL